MSKRELLFSITKKDFRVDTFRSGGKGGQYQNTTDSGVRIVHVESGAVGESREERSQPQNKKKALQRLVESPIFKTWHKRKVAEILRNLTSIEDEVERQMSPENLKIEIRENDKWVEEDADEHPY